MKPLKTLGLAAVAALLVAGVFGAGTASASGLYKYTTPNPNDPLGVGTVIEMTLEKETSLVTEDAFGLTSWTCTGSTLTAKIERVTPAGSPRGKITTLDYTGCAHTADVNALGEIEFRNIAGTTNATVFLIGTTVTEFNTLLNQNCASAAGQGTDIGILTGAKAVNGMATLDLNGLLPLENCNAANARLTGKYWVTNPIGLTVEAA